MLAGCRFEFAELHDAAVPKDAPPQGLACNTPIRLGDGAGSELAATATATRVFGAWLDRDGAIHGGGAQIAAQTATPFYLGTQVGPFAHAGVAADATGKSILGIATDLNGASFLQVADDTTLAYGDIVQSTIALTGAHGVAATGVDTPAWIFAGNDSATTREQAAGVSRATEIAPALDCGNFSSRTTIVPFGARIAITDDVAGNDCDIKTVDNAVTTRSASATWGTAGQCTQATAMYSAGHTDVLLVRHSLTDNDLNHVIATLNSSGTVTIPGESRLDSPANEARGAGVTDGFWVLYETAGSLAAAHLDFAGTKGTPIALGSVPSATGHDLVVFGGDPYAIWLGDGLQLARLCE